MFSGFPSVRPSVHPKPEIPSFDLYVGPLAHPTNRDRFMTCPSVLPPVCPFVRPSVRRGFRAFAGECMEGMANFTCWSIMATFRTDSFMATVCWFFLILAIFWLSETGQIWGFRALSGECKENWRAMLHADVSWPPSELISVWPLSVNFSNFSPNWLSETVQIWGFRAFPGERIEGIAWNLACWCILTTFRTDLSMVTVCRYFMENAWRE